MGRRMPIGLPQSLLSIVANALKLYGMPGWAEVVKASKLVE